MRARDRAQVERLTRIMLEGVKAEVRIVWARSIGADYGLAMGWGRSEFWILFPEDRTLALDTIAHEAAHVLAWDRYGAAIQDHGPEWRRTYRRLLRTHGQGKVYPE